MRQVNAELAKVHTDLVAYVRANGLKLTTTEYTHKSGTAAAEQECGGNNKSRTLVKAYTDKDRTLHCLYDCVPPATEKKQ
jgi:hypothetical protein